MIADVLIFAQDAVEPSRFARMVVDGLSLGTIDALLAVGFVIIFKSTQVLNFAHGALAALGAFFVASYATIVDIPGRWMPGAPVWVPWTLAVLIALLTMALVGAVLERLFLRPMVGEELFALAIITLGLDIVLRNITNDWIGPTDRPLGDPFGLGILDLGWVTIPHTQMQDSKLLILDEPSLGLAPLLVQEVRDIIVEINEQGTAVLLIEQNASMALSIAHQGYIMETGKMVMDGDPQNLLKDEDVKEFYLGLHASGEKKSFRDVKHYKRRKRWLS